MAFADNLQQLPAVTHLVGLDLVDASGATLARIENQPGQAGSLRVYAALAQRFGAIDAAAAQEGLALYAEHTDDARANPGKHPNIDRLFALAAGGAPLAVTLRPTA
jgi:hypothetical protein